MSEMSSLEFSFFLFLVIHTATRQEQTFKILFEKSQKKRNKVITLLSLFHRINE